jgi:hypothetical protein
MQSGRLEAGSRHQQVASRPATTGCKMEFRQAVDRLSMGGCRQGVDISRLLAGLKQQEARWNSGKQLIGCQEALWEAVGR